MEKLRQVRERPTLVVLVVALPDLGNNFIVVATVVMDRVRSD
jgi:hypothetical protein